MRENCLHQFLESFVGADLMGDRQDYDKRLSSFLETFPIPLHHNKPKPHRNFTVFWSKPESQNNSSSDDVGMIYEMIKSVFMGLGNTSGWTVIKFWVPVTIGGRRVLSSAGQPFAVSCLDDCFAKYMLHSQEYMYNIDETNHLDIEKNPMILNGDIATAFISRFAETVNYKKQGSLLDRDVEECKLKTSYLIPLWSPSHSSSHCIGVVEHIYSISYSDYQIDFRRMRSKIEKVGLRVFRVQEHIPYESINGLKRVTLEIEDVLETICKSHNILLAQVWMAYEDETHEPFSSSLGVTPKNRMLSLKLTGYCVHGESVTQECLDQYCYDCDTFPLKAGEEVVEETLQDYEPRFCHGYVPSYDDETEGGTLVICLRSINTGDLNYAFEFIWNHGAKYAIFLELLLLTLKRCLPSFKFATGAELGDELDVVKVDKSTSETQNFKIFQRKKVSLMTDVPEKGKKQMVDDLKLDSIYLLRQVIEQGFEKTQKEVAQNHHGSLSTLKRKSHSYGVSESQGPSLAKRKVDDSSDNQNDKNEENTGLLQNPLAVNNNENNLIIKAEYEGDMIKFHLSISEAKFVTVEKEIGLQFKLTMGTYKLKYLDEDGDWILLKSDQDMSYCIKSSRKFDRILVRLRVEQSTLLHGPTGSKEMYRFLSEFTSL